MAKSERLGLSGPLFDPSNAKLDIVFVHGLGGDRVLTWTHTPSSTFWPRDLLPKACPQARILTFGYNSNWVGFFGLTGSGRVSLATIGDHSEALLGDLAAIRDRTATINRPIIFVAHSLGGLICANALATTHEGNIAAQNVVKATKAAMFFGTPFEGSSKARWALFAERFLKVFTETNDKNVSALERESETLASINSNFAKFLMTRAKSNDEHGVEIACFFEELSTKIKGKSVGRVVTRESATIVGVDPIGIEADHRSMCKFEDEERRGYIRASEKLRSWMKQLDGEQEKCSENYSVYQGSVTYGEIKGNSGVIAGNVYTPARNGITITGSVHYH